MNNQLIIFFFTLCITLSIATSSSGSYEVTQPCQDAVGGIFSLSYPNATMYLTYSGKAMNDLGNFDECLDMYNNTAQYCVYENTLLAEGDYVYYMGVCYPSVCTTEDVLELAPQYSLLPRNGTGTPSIHCYTDKHRDSKDYTRGSYAMIAISAFIGLLVLLGTTVDYVFFERIYKYQKKQHVTPNPNTQFNDYKPLLETFILNNNDHIEKREDQDCDDDDDKPLFYNRLENVINFESPNFFIKFLLCFSLIKNYSSFANSSSPKKYFDSLDGVRTLSSCWVIMGHTLLFNGSLGYDNVMYIISTARMGFAFQVIPAGEYAVDIFFFLSGFLVTFSVMNQLDKFKAKSCRSFGNLKFWSLYIVHRIIRLSPLFIYVLFFFMYIGSIIGTGPMYYLYDTVVNPMCHNNWWTNILYINNLTSVMSQECLSWTWYLANDMQFYLVAPFVIVAYRRNKIIGWAMIGFLLSFCFSITTWVSIKNQLAPFFVFSNRVLDSESFITDIYQKPWNRIGPYLIGIGIAFLYKEDKVKRIYKSQKIRYIFYLIALGLTFFFSYIPYSYYSTKGWNNIESSLFSAFGHTLFTVGFAIFILGTFYGYGGFLKWILELSIWKPFSKLTYSVYLIHPVIIMVRVLSSSQMFHYSWTEFAYSYIGNLAVSFGAAFVIHLCVEKSFVNLERLIFPH
ncbi:hypothetical protein CYY_008142 [Polysphondylium violaceum]|uniref:Acyltransferase 3 domain-containing protein n=1 Tax=Polysphondylium violaceum TaxID=133409 RepID=A0A8J4PP21_9MYCE|nr:hypothetical protein CYY_008142 [Polysphondylium violaceum]